MTDPVVTGILFDQSFYQVGQTITATVNYQTTNQYSSYEFVPTVTDVITSEASAATIGTFTTAYNNNGAEGYTDGFASSSFSSYWQSFATSGSSVGTATNQAQVSLANASGTSPSWAGISSTASTSLLGSSFSFQVTGLGGAGDGPQDTYLGIYLTAAQSSSSAFTPLQSGDFITFNVASSGIASGNQTNLTSGYSLGGNQSIQSSTITPYDNANSFLRIREVLGVVYWDISPDGVTWENYASLADSAIPFSLTDLYVNLAAFNTGSQGSTLTFTNFSYMAAGAGTPDPVTATAADTGDRSWTLTENTLTGSASPFTGTAIFTATA